MSGRDPAADVAIAGGGVAGSAAALACVHLGLDTLWFRDAARPGSAWLESLAPEGRGYLRQLLDDDEIRISRRGVFRVLETEGRTRVFDSMFGEGIHLILEILIRQLTRSALQRGMRDVGPLRTVRRDGNDRFELMDREGGIFHSRYLIDATGIRAIAARQLGMQRIKIGGERFVERFRGARSMSPNRARFERLPSGGWRFQAIDAQGGTTITQSNAGPAPDRSERRNMRWQCSRCFVREGLLTVGDCAYRFDPSCGLGMTRALKSALLAARAVHRAIREPHQATAGLARHEQQMKEDFLELLRALCVAQGEPHLVAEYQRKVQTECSISVSPAQIIHSSSPIR